MNDNAITGAVIGLVGVLLGVFIGEFLRRRKEKQEIERMMKAISEELASVKLQIPLLKKAIDIQIKSLKSPKPVLATGFHQLFIDIGFKELFPKVYSNYCRIQRENLQSIYFRIRLVSQQMKLFPNDIDENYLRMKAVGVVNELSRETLYKEYEKKMNFLLELLAPVEAWIELFLTNRHEELYEAIGGIVEK